MSVLGFVEQMPHTVKPTLLFRAPNEASDVASIATTIFPPVRARPTFPPFSSVMSKTPSSPTENAGPGTSDGDIGLVLGAATGEPRDRRVPSLSNAYQIFELRTAVCFADVIWPWPAGAQATTEPSGLSKTEVVTPSPRACDST